MDDTLVQNQMNRERYNSQVYFYIASQFQNQSFDGFAKYFRKQAEDEIGHAQVFIDYLVSKRQSPVFQSLNSVSFADLTPPALLQRAYALEVSTTEQLNMLYGSSEDDNNYQLCAVLDVLLREQVEEETSTYDLFDLLSKTDGNGWVVLDKEYGAKV